MTQFDFLDTLTKDGDGKTISNLTITGNNEYIGLFGFVEADYRYDFFVNNLIFGINLIDVQISGKKYVGGLVGENFSGTIENCTANAEENAMT